MRKWSEIVLEGVSRGKKTFENIFHKFNLASTYKNQYGYKGNTYRIEVYGHKKTGNTYFIEITRTEDENGKIVYIPVSLTITNDKGTVFDVSYGMLPKKYNLELGFPETVESAKIIERLLTNLIETGDYNKFIKDWRIQSTLEYANEEPDTAFEKPLSRFAGMEGKEIKEGGILEYTWGYEQTNVEFYKVLTRKGDIVTLRKLENKQISFDRKRLASEEVPSNKLIGDTLKKKVIDGWKSEVVNMPYGIAEPWNGKPVEATHYA